MIQGLQFGEGHGNQLYSRLRKLPIEMMKPSTFVSEDVMSNEAVVKVLGVDLVQLIHEECCRTLELFIWAENFLREMYIEDWFKKREGAAVELVPSASFEDTLLRFMMYHKMHSMDLLKRLPAMALNEYFPSTVSEELLKGWNGPDSVAAWLFNDCTKGAMKQPIVKAPRDLFSFAFGEELLRCNNIEKITDLGRFQLLMQEMEEPRELESVDLTDEQMEYLTAGEYRFGDNCTASDLKELAREYFKLAKMRLNERFCNILRRNVEGGNLGQSLARGGYLMLYNYVLCLVDDDFKLPSVRPSNPLVPIDI